MAGNLLNLLRKRLSDLKEQAQLSDTDLAEGMREVAPHVKAYQQKVSDFFSTEMKRPELDFIAALCLALGVTFSQVLAAIERDAPIRRDQDWDWLMFGRRLGPTGREGARGFVEGVKSPAPSASTRPRPVKRRTRAGDER